MDKTDIEKLGTYEVLECRDIPDIKSKGWILAHKKTKAHILLLENDDDNKVFTVSFRTPAQDDTGVFHIIEHTVLCGSEKYLVKDPFMELAKGSMNTFLNALTYPDRTLYPVASTNDVDFKNLMSVYMDAVFRPNIYKEEKIFKQEGWHYELDSPEDDLKVNGIVYNEMKGVYSSVENLADGKALSTLFPDSIYANESGGNPDFIPELTYEKYLDTHRKHYHPSNSFIYLYGDMDLVERLKWIDENYLSDYDYLEVDTEVPYSEAAKETKEVEVDYPITDGDNEEESYLYSLNYALFDNSDIKLSAAFATIDYALMDMPGAPLKEALIKSGIGTEVYSYFENDIRQCVYNITVKSAKPNCQEQLKKIVDETLSKIIADGLDKETLKSRIISEKFKLKESDFGRYPKGLMRGLSAYNLWLYDESKVLDLFETDKVMAELESLIDTDYFDDILREYVFDNERRALITMVPKKGLLQEKEQKLHDQLQEQKSHLKDEEIQELVEQTKELKAYQSEETPEELLDTIPVLKISDINPDPKPIKGQLIEEDGIKYLYSDIETNGIAYIDIVFDISKIPYKYLPYLGYIKMMFLSMDTDSHTYAELNQELGMKLGGMNIAMAADRNLTTNEIFQHMVIGSKVLYENIPYVFDIAKEFITQLDLSDTKHLKELVEENISRQRETIVSNGDETAATRAESYFNEVSYFKDQVTGLAAFGNMKKTLESFDESKDELIKIIKEMMSYVFNKDSILINYAGSKESFEEMKKYSKAFRDAMFDSNIREEIESRPDADQDYKPERKNEAIITPSQVQYVSRVGNFALGKEEKFDEIREIFRGVRNVLSQILKTDYLWNNIRVLGGAYGCNSIFTASGDATFTSYRDPNLKKTNDVYMAAADYIENFDVSEHDMRKFIIGTMSDVDRPKTPSAQATRELTFYWKGITYDELKKNRARILNATPEDIRAFAPLVRDAMNQNYICVVGGKTQIEESKDLFDNFIEL